MELSFAVFVAYIFARVGFVEAYMETVPAIELAVWRLLVRGVELGVAPKWVIRGWEALRAAGRGFVVSRLHAIGVTPRALAGATSHEGVVAELRRIASIVRLWMARHEVVAPSLVALVADRLAADGLLSENDVARITKERSGVARTLCTEGCTSEGLFSLLVSFPMDWRSEPLAATMRLASLVSG
jgi:hypothetical protein